MTAENTTRKLFAQVHNGMQRHWTVEVTTILTWIGNRSTHPVDSDEALQQFLEEAKVTRPAIYAGEFKTGQLDAFGHPLFIYGAEYVDTITDQDGTEIYNSKHHKYRS